MRRPPSSQEPITAAECRRRSREALERRVAQGATHDTDVDMPRRDTARQWLANDPALRERRAAAVEMQEQVLAEDLIAAADRDAEQARGSRRVAAIRRQIAARTQWLRTLAARAKADSRDDAPAVGISDEGVAMLQKACDEMMGAANATDDPSSTRDDEDDDAAESSSSDSSSSSPEGEDPRVFDAPEQKNVDARPYGRVAPRPFEKEGRGHDEKNNDDEKKRKTAPPAPAPSNASPPRVDRYGNRLDPPDTFTPKWFDDDDLRRRHEPPPYDPFEW